MLKSVAQSGQPGFRKEDVLMGEDDDVVHSLIESGVVGLARGSKATLGDPLATVGDGGRGEQRALQNTVVVHGRHKRPFPEAGIAGRPARRL